MGTRQVIIARILSDLVEDEAHYVNTVDAALQLRMLVCLEGQVVAEYQHDRNGLVLRFADGDEFIPIVKGDFRSIIAHFAFACAGNPYQGAGEAVWPEEGTTRFRAEWTNTPGRQQLMLLVET